jgi:hypothetical protein
MRELFVGLPCKVAWCSEACCGESSICVHPVLDISDDLGIFFSDDRLHYIIIPE